MDLSSNSSESKIQQFFSSVSEFGWGFWLANIIELFERMAFYAAVAILAIYLEEKLGLDDSSSLTGLFTGVIYFMPFLAGVFVDKFGFKKTLLVCFLIFALGYSLIALPATPVGSFLMKDQLQVFVLIVLIFTALGGSMIKPCITGVVEVLAPEQHKALGFSIYYTLVNLGGALGPTIGLFVRKHLGLEYVLLMSASFSLLVFVLTLLFFREPRIPQREERSLGSVLMDMLTVFINVRFLVFLVIFSGFWMMFWQIFLLVPFYARDILKYENYEILESVDAYAIICLTIPLSIVSKKLKPIAAMIVGFVIASLGWMIVGIVPTVTGAFAALVVFAIGEALQAPRFYEYVGSLAPRKMVGIFMGFSFMPIAIGSVAAGYLADHFRKHYFEDKLIGMWLILGGIGLISTFLMIIYNRILLSQKKY